MGFFLFDQIKQQKVLPTIGIYLFFVKCAFVERIIHICEQSFQKITIIEFNLLFNQNFVIQYWCIKEARFLMLLETTSFAKQKMEGAMGVSSFTSIENGQYVRKICIRGLEYNFILKITVNIISICAIFS